MAGRVLPQKEAAKYLGLTVKTLRSMRKLGIGPSYIKMFTGRDTGNPTIGYTADCLDDWIDSCRTAPVEALISRYS